MHQGNIDSIVVMAIQWPCNKPSDRNITDEIPHISSLRKMYCLMTPCTYFSSHFMSENKLTWMDKTKTEQNNKGYLFAALFHLHQLNQRCCCRPVFGTYGGVKPEPFQLGRGRSRQHLPRRHFPCPEEAFKDLWRGRQHLLESPVVTLEPN